MEYIVSRKKSDIFFRLSASCLNRHGPALDTQFDFLEQEEIIVLIKVECSWLLLLLLTVTSRSAIVV